MFYLAKMLKRKEKPLYPMAKARGLYGLFSKIQFRCDGASRSEPEFRNESGHFTFRRPFQFLKP